MTILRRTPLALSLIALLAACGSDPTPAPVDASSDTTDVSSDAAGDAAQDVSADTTGNDAGNDGAPADVPAADAASDDATRDAAGDTSTDAIIADGSTDVGADGATDARADVQTDASTDTASCVEGAVRCDAPLTAQTCRGGVWVSTTCRGFGAALGTYESCYQGACFDCLAGDGGVGCAASPPLCMTDAECYTNGRGRCVDGRCARRGPVECTSETDCTVWAPSTSAGCSAATIAGRSTRVCGDNATRCTVDAMCPAAFRCDATTGFCARR